MYLHRNDFKSKKAVKEAVAKGEKLTYFQPGPFGGNEPKEGTIFLEGPHYPQPHRWYAQCEAKDGVIVRCK